MSDQTVDRDEGVSPTPEAHPSFGDILSEYEQSHQITQKSSGEGREGTVVAVSPDSIFVDVGLKIEGVVPVSEFKADELPKRGDKLQVSITGRNDEGYYLLSK